MPGSSSALRGREPRAPLLIGLTVIIISAIVALAGPQILSLILVPSIAQPSILVLLFASLVGLNVVSYIAWPSAWNVPAHMQLASGIVVYGTAIFFTDTLSSYDPDVLITYIQVIVIGFVCLTIGALVGLLVSRRLIVAVPLRFVTTNFDDLRTGPMYTRLAIALGLALVGLALAFAIMGFIPAFAADPIAAKFFRAQYAALYAPAAPIFRAATGALSVLIPTAVLVAFRKRSLPWVLLAAGAVVGMLLTLQREPATSGLLLAIGAFMASRPRLPGKSVLFVVLMTFTYAFGAVSYYLLGFGDSYASASNPFEVIVAGSPDIGDQLHFLTNWLSNPIYTFGRTFYGGLIPGQYEWNSSVWALQIISPGSDANSVLSGGIRLPAPIWGLVAFGWPGLVAVSALSGFLISILSYAARVAVAAQHELTNKVIVIVLYLSAFDAFTVFYRMQYLQVLQFAICLIVVRGLARSGPEFPVSLTRPDALSAHERLSASAPR